MANDPLRRVPPTEGAPEPGFEQGPTTKTFSLKMQSWLMDSGVEAPVEIETAPAAPSPAAAPPPDAASPFASRPYHQFAAPPIAAARPPTPVPAAELAPLPALAPITSPDAIPTGSAPAASVLRASAVPPIPALAASAVPPIPGLAGGAPREAPRPRGLVLVGAGVVAVLAAATASWFLWGEHIRALLKV